MSCVIKATQHSLLILVGPFAGNDQARLGGWPDVALEHQEQVKVLLLAARTLDDIRQGRILGVAEVIPHRFRPMDLG